MCRRTAGLAGRREPSSRGPTTLSLLDDKTAHERTPRHYVLRSKPEASRHRRSWNGGMSRRMPVRRLLLLCVLSSAHGSNAVSKLSQLYEDLLFFYVPEVRPVEKPTDVLNISFGAYLIQLHDVDEKRQQLTTNLWLEMQWYDWRLHWDPVKYEGIKSVHIPPDQMWTPDIVLYNNAAGNPQITISTDVLVMHTGKVIWKPPVVLKSFCAVNMQYFPYDEQQCPMKFGTWSYDGEYVDLTRLNLHDSHHYAKNGQYSYDPSVGMDMSYYYPSMEWDILNLTAVRHEAVYPGCCGNKTYIDVTYFMHIRRRPLFYTANMILPCLLMSPLTVFLFYLPSEGKRLTCAMGILVALSVFFLLLIEIMPATSLTVPVMSKFLLFNICCVSVASAVSVIIVNIHRRDANSQRIGRRWQMILERISPICGIGPESTPAESTATADIFLVECDRALRAIDAAQSSNRNTADPLSSARDRMRMRILKRTAMNVKFIANFYRRRETRDAISLEWTRMALLVDRVFFWLFAAVTVFGTAAIMLEVPNLFFDNRPSLPQPMPAKPLGYSSQTKPL